MRVGVLALQGDVREHLKLLVDVGATAAPVKTIEHLEDVDALVIPGGESTTIGFMLDEHDMIGPLRKRIEDGMPVFGTCAGAILLAKDVVPSSPVVPDARDGEDSPGIARVSSPSMRDWPRIGVLDAVVRRNGFGRQVDSFEGPLDVEGVGTVEAVFIRAPVIESVAEGVTVLATTHDHPCVIRQGNMLAATFHPELSGDTGLHRYFVEEVHA